MISPTIRPPSAPPSRGCGSARSGAHPGVLEPRSSTMKRGIMKDALPLSVEPADRILCLYRGLSWDAPAVVCEPRHRVRASQSRRTGCRGAAEARAGDHVLSCRTAAWRHSRELLAKLGEGAARDRLSSRVSIPPRSRTRHKCWSAICGSSLGRSLSVSGAAPLASRQSPRRKGS